MNKQQIIEYINHPELLGESNFSDLKTLSEKYPYSGILQTLYAKALHNDDSIFFEEQLKKTAIVNSNRKKLYKVIHQPKLQKTIDKIEVDIQLEKNEGVHSTPELEPPVKPKESTTESSTELDELEKNILTEAINSSMHLDVSDIIPPIEELTTASDEKPNEESTNSVEESKSNFTDWFSSGNSNFKKRKDISGLVEGFLEADDSQSEKKEFFSPTNLAKMSLVDNEEFVTETLAKVYASQGNFEKAILIYERLMIDNPEKNTFFASRIRFLKEKKENKLD